MSYVAMGQPLLAASTMLIYFLYIMLLPNSIRTLDMLGVMLGFLLLDKSYIHRVWFRISYTSALFVQSVRTKIACIP